MPNSIVFVIDCEGTPLLPTCSARSRILLKKGKATVEQIVPFTIRLRRKVDNPIGEFTMGIDDGAKKVGVAVAYQDKVVFAGEIKLRQDVHRKMTQRASYRRVRRSRNLRHRKARFLNRGKEGWLPPTILQKKESIIRVVKFLKKYLNVTKVVVEQGQFDTASMSTGYKLTGKEYQKREYEGNNWRQKVLWRDKYECQHCGSNDNLQAHHIVGRIKGGTNRVSNGITLCNFCHQALHKGGWSLSVKRMPSLKYPAHLQQGKWWLFNELKKLVGDVKVCYGWMTAKARRTLNLAKSHWEDASAMIRANKLEGMVYLIIPKRCKVWENHPTRTCTERKGFKHRDLVKAKHRTRGMVVGTVRSLKQKAITLRTSFDDNFPISYSKAKLLWRFGGLEFLCFSIV